jgi:hypothetical protein
MNLGANLKVVSQCHLIKVSNMELDRPYTILHAENVQTKYEPTVVLALQDAVFQLIKVFLPRSYGIVFTTNNIHYVNEATVAHDLTYNDTCIKTKASIWILCPRSANYNKKEENEGDSQVTSCEVVCM